jgi:3-isopropylmalate/(R)-2-methylmalate dehydratase large subunit
MDGCVFIDRHFIHEVTSPVAFRFKRKRPVLYPERTTADHNTPTINQHLPWRPLSANQLRALEENSKEYGSATGIRNKKWNRSCRVLKTELHYLALLLFARFTYFHPRCLWCHCFGLVLEVEMVLSTQCIMQPKPRKMLIQRRWWSSLGVTPKDVALYHLKTIH